MEPLNDEVLLAMAEMGLDKERTLQVGAVRGATAVEQSPCLGQGAEG